MSRKKVGPGRLLWEAFGPYIAFIAAAGVLCWPYFAFGVMAEVIWLLVISPPAIVILIGRSKGAK